MKHIITLLLITIGILSMNAVAASIEDIAITLTQEDIDSDYKDRPDKGSRSAPAPVICVINFTESTIETSIRIDVILYEIWDEKGEINIASCIDECDIIEHLSTLSGKFQLRLITDKCQYVGYVKLLNERS